MAHQIKCIHIAVNLLKCSVRRFMFYNVLLKNRSVFFSTGCNIYGVDSMQSCNIYGVDSMQSCNIYGVDQIDIKLKQTR